VCFDAAFERLYVKSTQTPAQVFVITNPVFTDWSLFSGGAKLITTVLALPPDYEDLTETRNTGW
jgi:hypothetical protein